MAMSGSTALEPANYARQEHRRFASRRPWAAAVAVGIAVCVASAACSSGGTSKTSDAGPGITSQAPLSPFVASDKVGAKPKLPKVIAYAQDSTNETEQALGSGVSEGAKDAGLTYSVTNSGGDPQKQVQNMQQFLVKGVGALVTGPVDPASQAPVLRDAINKGVAAMTLVFGPGTEQVNASQYAVGKALADVAATYINQTLAGKANVVLINQDNVAPIKPRFDAIRTVLKQIPGVTIVADITAQIQDNQHGFQVMNTILQKNPNVDVVLGSDEVVQGALAALQADHKATDRQFVGGLDGEPSSLTAIAAGGPYKATVALAPAIFGYAWARFAADWLAGKSIPQAINVEPIALTSKAAIDAYNADENSPAAVWNDPARLGKYLQFFGNISYATRGDYLAYNWSVGN